MGGEKEIQVTEEESTEEIKKCPKCGAPTVLEGGCASVHCAVCGEVWCYKCGIGFENSRSCYEHLATVHGGLY